MKKSFSIFWHCFLWLSATNPFLFDKINDSSAKGTRVALSIFVLITGIFAFSSASFFFLSFFSVYDEATKATTSTSSDLFCSMFLGLIWACLIMTLDRMILASRNSKMSLLLRIPLSIAIALVISIPLETQFFEAKITKELNKSSLAENKEIETKKDNVLTELDADIRDAKHKVSFEQQEIAKWSDIKQAEEVGRVIGSTATGKIGYGPAYHGAVDNIALHSNFLKDDSIRLNRLILSRDSVEKKVNIEFQRTKIEQSYDFASRYQSLCQLRSVDPNINRLCYGICFLLILVELTPALMKLLKDDDPYDYLFDALQETTAATIIAMTNYHTTQINLHGHDILLKKHEHHQPKFALPGIFSSLL